MNAFKEIQELALKSGCEFTLVVKAGYVKAEIKQDYQGQKRGEINEMHGDAMAIGDIGKCVERVIESMKLPYIHWRP